MRSLPSVLLVDDDVAFCSAFERRHRGTVALTVANDSEAARVTSRRSSPQVALVDRILPSGSGVELIPWLRATHRAIWIVLVTAAADHDATVMAMSVGADDVIEKPFTMQNVFERQSKLLQEQARSLPTLREHTILLVHRAVRAFHGNRTKAARRLDVSRTTIAERLRRGQ